MMHATTTEILLIAMPIIVSVSYMIGRVPGADYHAP
jgi:hypothetical protein